MTGRLLSLCVAFGVAWAATSANARPPKRATNKPPRKNPETVTAEKIADGLLDIFAGKSKFRVSTCPEVTPTQWASLLLLNDGVPMKYAFSEGCDVEGDAVLRREPFPLDVKLRNFLNVERLRATVDAEAKPDWTQGIVRAEVHFKDATLESTRTGWNGPVAFTAVIRVATGLADATGNDLAGEIRLYKVRNVAVDVRRRFP